MSIYSQNSSKTAFDSIYFGNSLNKARKQRKRNNDAARKAMIERDRRLRLLKGFTLHDPMFDLDVDVSVDGQGFSNPLTDTVPGQRYLVRCKIAQHQGEPLLQGFSLAWLKPKTWSWADGIGQRTIDETISNSLVITRVCLSPGFHSYTKGDSSTASSLRMASTDGFSSGMRVKVGAMDSFVMRTISSVTSTHVRLTKALESAPGDGTLVRSGAKVAGVFKVVVMKRYEEGR